MYQLTSLLIDSVTVPNPAIIERTSDSAFIPTVPGNTDYDEYLAWLAEGNEPLPADEPS